VLAPLLQLLGLSSVGCALRHSPKHPQDWRLPTPTETAQEWRKDNSHRYPRVTADFDGDGHKEPRPSPLE